jgi:hypothetical protein
MGHGRPEEAEILQLIPAIALPRLSDLSLPEIDAMIGSTLEDFTQTRASRDLCDFAEARGETRGEARGEARVTLRQLHRLCGPLRPVTTARIQCLPLDQLEALTEALLDFRGPDDLQSCLAAQG